MKKKVITGSMIAAIAIISFYLGTTVNSLLASPGSFGNKEESSICAVVLNSKIYVVWWDPNYRFVYKEAIPYKY